MAWHASLKLDYTLQQGRTTAHFLHQGPLRVLQNLYPEGDAVCHNVLVHPPGGLVGGDTLDIAVHAHAGAHGLLTTPGATRFYRCDGAPALQRTHVSVEADARLEWLPLEAICYSGCLATNQLTLSIQPGGEVMGWDITALGLPHANQPFVQGHFCQHIELPGIWLERGTLHASDQRLLHSPVGMAGQCCMASLIYATGSPMTRTQRQEVLDTARTALAGHPLAATAGATSPNAQVVVVRVLAPMVEPASMLLREVRNLWRAQLWGKTNVNPRIWST